jgi:hypothetical protein
MKGCTFQGIKQLINDVDVWVMWHMTHGHIWAN